MSKSHASKFTVGPNDAEAYAAYGGRYEQAFPNRKAPKAAKPTHWLLDQVVKGKPAKVCQDCEKVNPPAGQACPARAS